MKNRLVSSAELKTFYNEEGISYYSLSRRKKLYHVKWDKIEEINVSDYKFREHYYEYSDSFGIYLTKAGRGLCPENLYVNKTCALEVLLKKAKDNISWERKCIIDVLKDFKKWVAVEAETKIRLEILKG